MRSDEELYEIIETEAKSGLEDVARAYVSLINGLIGVKTKLAPEEMDRMFKGDKGERPLILKYADVIIKKQVEKLESLREEEKDETKEKL